MLQHVEQTELQVSMRLARRARLALHDERKGKGGLLKVLIAEDEVELARGLKYLLEKNRFSVDIVHNGRDALDWFHGVDYDAVVLDIMMPKMNGIEVLRAIRQEGSAVPIMLLTAKGEIEDRVLGLESGADDYLPKPFATKEFVARVKALARRSGSAYAGNVLRLGSVELDCDCYELRVSSGSGGPGDSDSSVRLNNKEFQVLELFMRHPRQVFSTEHLMENIWGLEAEANIDVVWTYIGFIRKKLRAINADIEIRTVRGAGYVLEELER